ncbi:MAG: 8-amino-7-oxononanoate synthase [Gammaproteobacteria bacterium]
MQIPISQKLTELKQQGAYRQRRQLGSPQDIKVIIDGKQFLSFCSNDYLGLANDPRVCQAAKDAISHYGVGTGASQLISGYSTLHASLEEQLSEFLGYQRCVLFSSGYLANLGVISALSSRHSLILQDRLNHASLIDAAKNASGDLKRYHHRDTNQAQDIVNDSQSDSHLIVSDGVFSMEGSIAPIDQLHQLKRDSNDKLIIDDAHGIGVLGLNGRGSLEHLGVDTSKVDVLIGTFGKAFGGSGAFVLSDNNTIDFLIQKARTLIYTTAPPAALAAAATQSLNIIINEPERRQKLLNNIQYFRHAIAQTNLQLLESITAIQTIIIGENKLALNFSSQLERRGLLVLAIRPPTVPKNTARLRITLSSEHTLQQIDQLANALTEVKNSIALETKS